MADSRISQNIKNVIADLRKLVPSSEAGSKALAELTRVFAEVSGGQFSRNFDDIAKSVSKLSDELNRLGLSKTSVTQLKTELLNLGATQARLPSVRQVRQNPYSGAAEASVANKSERLERANILEKAQVRLLQEEIARLTSIEVVREKINQDHAQLNAATKETIRLEREREANRFTGHRVNLSNYQFSSEIAQGGRRPRVQQLPGGFESYKDFIEQQKQFGDVIPGGNTGLRNFQQALKNIGVEAQRVHQPIIDASTGIATIAVEAENSGGALVRAQLRMDRFGRVLQDTSKRFRTFGSAIVRDTFEVLKWSIAIGLVYTPIRAFNESLRQAIDLQTELANAQIVLSETTEGITGVFKAARQVADETGTSLVGVLKGYNEAAAATASISNEAERAVATQALLRDSMILAQLAGIDQSEALDTLVGALRQTNRDMTQGQEIIDGWVATSKAANVSINTLASTFAIVGDAAEGAGVSIDQLNGLAATLAEATKLSADETGNAIRGMISGFQSPQAENALASFGIAVRNVNGEMRSFTDLLEEIVNLRDQGLLSPQDVQEIANVVGGGYRRGAQLATLLENYDRSLALTSTSQNAAGDTAEAMAIKLDTVQVSTTKLQNAMTNLAQTLGTAGGILGQMDTLIKVLTSVVDVLELLTRALGKATPELIAFGGALAVLNFTQSGSQLLNRNLPTGLSDRLLKTQAGRLYGASRLGGYGLGGPPPLSVGQGYDVLNQAYLSTLNRVPIVGGRLSAKGSLLGGAFTGIAAGGSIISGIGAGPGRERERDFEKAGAQIAGGIVGTLIGGGVGTVLGTIIAGAFVDTATQDLGSLVGEINRLQALPGGPQEPTADTKQQLEQDRQQRQSELEKQLEPGALTEFFLRIAASVGRADVFGLGGKNPEITPEALRLGQFKARTGEIQLPKILQGAIFGGKFITQEQLNAYKELIDLQQQQQEINQGGPPLPGGTQSELNKLIQQRGQENYNRVLEQFQRGTPGVGIRQLTEASDLVNKLDDQSRTLVNAFDISGVNVDLNDLLTVLINISDQERTSLITLAQGVLEAKNALDEGKISADEFNDAVQNFQVPYEATQLQVRATQVRQPQVLNLGDITKQQAQATLELAGKLQDQWFDALEEATGQDIPEDVRQELKDRGEESIIAIGEGADQAFTDIITKIPQKFVQQALGQEGIGDQFKSIGFQDFRSRGLTTADIPKLLQREQQIAGSLVSATGGAYQPQREDVAIIFQDGIKTLHVDLSLLNLAMDDLIDLNQDQLEGIFNIPEGLTAFIPATGRTYFSDQPFPTGGTTTAPWDFPTGTAEEVGSAIAEAISEQTQRYIEKLTTGAPLSSPTTPKTKTPVYDYDKATLNRIGPQKTDKKLSNIGGAEPLINLEGVLAELGNRIVANLPASIPVTTNVDFKATIPVIIDGSQIMQAVQKRLFSDLKTAKKRTGTTGYIVE